MHDHWQLLLYCLREHAAGGPVQLCSNLHEWHGASQRPKLFNFFSGPILLPARHFRPNDEASPEIVWLKLCLPVISPAARGFPFTPHPVAQTALVCDGGSSQCRWFLRPMMSFLQKLLGREKRRLRRSISPQPQRRGRSLKSWPARTMDEERLLARCPFGSNRHHFRGLAEFDSAGGRRRKGCLCGAALSKFDADQKLGSSKASPGNENN
jgi:hypothetical protein